MAEEGATIDLEGNAPKATTAIGSQKSKAADMSKLHETFSELDARLRAVIAALNDEIQVVIGSVQIQDAKATKQQADLTLQLTEFTVRQTEISVRQTRWTIVLAVLAALYLPMTLVTGIFGMNVKELSGDQVPNWWWVVVTWAVTMSITVGRFGRYALMEWRWYRQGMTVVEHKRGLTERFSSEQSHRKTKAEVGGANPTARLASTSWEDRRRKRPRASQHDGENFEAV